MENCKYWELQPKAMYVGEYHGCKIYRNKQICNGTKEREECSCYGDHAKCDFYPEKRKEGKHMKTAEMWIKAQEDGYCYEMITSQISNDEFFYQKDKGLFDGDGFQVTMDNFESFNEFMNEQWKLRTMTKAEVEAKFNIKIVGD